MKRYLQVVYELLSQIYLDLIHQLVKESFDWVEFDNYFLREYH